MSQGHPEGTRKIGSTFARRARTAELAGPVVVNVTVAVTDEELLMLTGVGETLQLTSSVPVQQVRLIVPWNPFTGARVTMEVPDWPAAGIVTLVGLAEML
jgi:hypothetical protein